MDEEVCLWVELRNHIEIQAVYGREAAKRVLQGMHQRMVHWGARTEIVRRASMRMRFRAVTLMDLCGSRLPGSSGDTITGGLEALQIRLAGEALDVSGQHVLPWVIVHGVETLGDAAVQSGRRDRSPDGGISDDASTYFTSRSRTDDWFNRYQHDMALAWRWRETLERGQASLVLQPVRRGCAGQNLYDEALLRIPADHGIRDASSRSVGEMVPALERLGLVRSLDRAVMAAVLDRLEADPVRRLGCNVSALSLRLDNWWGTLLRRLEARPDVAARLTVEITETMPIPDREAAAIFIGHLRGLGCRIALDDVGSGHSSLDMAREIRPDVIKLDAVLLHAARDTRQAALVLEKLAGYCQTLAPHVVIEGVEQSQDFALAQQAGVEWLQGYAIAMPGAPVPAMSVLPLTSRDMPHA